MNDHRKAQQRKTLAHNCAGSNFCKENEGEENVKNV